MLYERICNFCEKKYSVSKKEIKRTRYCSRLCANRANVKAFAEKQRKNRIKKECPTCKKIFSVKPSHDKKRKYCSSNCRIKDLNIEKICICCGKDFIVWKSRKIAKFCSNECRYKIHSQCMPQHDKHPNFTTGNRTYRRYAFRHLEKKCFLCEKTEGKIDVHHIDGNRDNNDLKNLQVVCRSCHCKIHGITPNNYKK